MAWWRDRTALKRVVHDLVAGELARLRNGGAAPPLRPWSDELPIGGEGLGADSLEILELSAALAEALRLARSGLEDGLLARRTLGGWIELCAAALARIDDEIAFRSSGTTGAPKTIVHRLAALEQEIDTLAGLLPGRRVLSVVPAHHIYGFLFTVLLPKRLSAPVEEIMWRSPESLGVLLASGDIMVAHPAWWQAFVRAGPKLPPGVLATISTAPCPPELFAALLDHGFARVIEIYGASETAGIGWRERPDLPFTLMPHWERDDAADVLHRVLPDGTLLTGNLPDRVSWRDARRFTVAGRRDGAVQVGGANVVPSAVRERLRAHELVADAVVRLMRADEGNRLKAFIVPRPERDGPAARDALARWIEHSLPVPERPKSLTFGLALPVGPLGKASDW